MIAAEFMHDGMYFHGVALLADSEEPTTTLLSLSREIGPFMAPELVLCREFRLLVTIGLPNRRVLTH